MVGGIAVPAAVIVVGLHRLGMIWMSRSRGAVLSFHTPRKRWRLRSLGERATLCDLRDGTMQTLSEHEKRAAMPQDHDVLHCMHGYDNGGRTVHTHRVGRSYHIHAHGHGVHAGRRSRDAHGGRGGRRSHGGHGAHGAHGGRGVRGVRGDPC